MHHLTSLREATPYSASPQQPQGNSGTGTEISKTALTKLPKLTLRRFKGDVTQFRTFWDIRSKVQFTLILGWQKSTTSVSSFVIRRFCITRNWRFACNRRKLRLGSGNRKESHPPSLHCALTLNSRSSFAIFRAPENPSFITLIFHPFFR